MHKHQRLKLAFQGVFARFMLGNSSSESAHEYQHVVKLFADKGLEFTQRKR